MSLPSFLFFPPGRCSLDSDYAEGWGFQSGELAVSQIICILSMILHPNLKGEDYFRGVNFFRFYNLEKLIYIGSTEV